MPANRLDFTDRLRLPLVRVAARLQQRPGTKARALAEGIVSILAEADAKGRAEGERLGDGHRVECQGHLVRATPEMIAFLYTLGWVLDLSSFVHKELEADPELADLLPLMKMRPRPKLDGG